MTIVQFRVFIYQSIPSSIYIKSNIQTPFQTRMLRQPINPLTQELSLISVQQRQPQIIQQLCQICYINYSKVKKEQLRPAHICYNCWYQHVKTNVSKISYMVGASLISPFQAEEEIDICMALNGLRKQHKEELEEFLYKKYTTFTKDIEKCPSQSCDFAFTMQKCKWSTGINHLCPKCQTPLIVSQNITLKSILGFVYFIFLANKCPKCQIPIERISGCPHMTCPCGHEFCWFCLKDHAIKDQNLYTVHEPKECAAIFFSKIIILFTCLMSLSCFLVGGQTLRYMMEAVFEFSGYIIHSIVIDLWVLAQWAVYTMYKDQPYRNLPFQRSPRYVKFGLWLMANLVFMGILSGLELLSATIAIIVIELMLVGVGAMVIYGVIFSCETWFEFIT